MVKRTDLTPPHERLQPGRDPTKALDRLYSEGRSYPQNRPHEVVRHSADPQASQPGKGHAGMDQLDPRWEAPVDINDQRAPGYFNETKGWVRGMGKDSPHPYFDHGREGREKK